VAERSRLVSVIVVNYNGAHLLPDCLASLEAQDYRPLEILVVDNGSIDDSRAVAAQYACRFVALEGNNGLPAAYNRGAEVARGEYLFFVNNDMRFDNECVRHLADALTADAAVFAADPLQFNWEGDRVIHARARLERIMSIRDVFSRTLIPLPPLKVNNNVASAAMEEVPWGCAGSLMVRRRAFEDVGAWDEKLFIDMEDVDLCWRAWRRGWPTVFVPLARLYHKWGASNDEQLFAAKDEQLRKRLARTSSGRLVRQQRNHLRFALKVLDWPSVVALTAIKTAAACVLLVRRPPIGYAFFRALGHVVLELPDSLAWRTRIARDAARSSRSLIRQFCSQRSPEAESPLVPPADNLVQRARR
jgi:GT2 family glycosyltransferase